ncbi:MAG: hypothetical protein LUM44_12055 [Pyrinomonadaceae bacterium]|nr:hypothetical protein [Pyrinomonadaceae bacterium]
MNEKFNVNNSSDEDWTISAPNENLPPNQTIIEPIEEWGMTGKLVSPNKNDGWKMPEPEFRKSDGSSPEEIIENSVKQEFQNSQPIVTEHFPPNLSAEPKFEFETSNSVPISPQAAVPVSAAIEAQPDISEAFAAAEIETPPMPPKKERSQAMKIFLAVFGILAMFAFALVFLTVVYFLFFYKASIE